MNDILNRLNFVNIVFYRYFFNSTNIMENTNNNILEILREILKKNNIKPDDIIDKFFNIKNEFNSKEEGADSFINNELYENLENPDDYKLLIHKLNNIKNTMNQLFLEISKNN